MFTNLVANIQEERIHTDTHIHTYTHACTHTSFIHTLFYIDAKSFKA